MQKTCRVCGEEFEAKRARAMYCSARCRQRAHRSGQTSPPRRRVTAQEVPGSSNAAELERTLAELRRMGRIETVDAAAVQALRSMARALDSDASQAALWRQYREALRELTADDSSSPVGDAIEALFAEVGNAPPS